MPEGVFWVFPFSNSIAFNQDSGDGLWEPVKGIGVYLAKIAKTADAGSWRVAPPATNP